MHPDNSDSLTGQPDVISHNTIPMLSRDQLFLNKIEQIIRDNLDNQGFTVPDLASAMELSVSQLNRRLNYLIDRPAGLLIRERRLTYAADCIRQNTASIKAIAGMTGYKDQAHFCRSFKKQYGCSPTEYGALEKSLQKTMRENGK